MTRRKFDRSLQLPGEEWRVIPGFSGYEVSDFGRTRSHYKQVRGDPLSSPGGWIVVDEPQRILAGGKTCKNRKYWKVALGKKGIQHDRYIHDLVMRAFVGIKPKGMQVCHFDGDPNNNRLENLRYGTPRENMDDAERHGTPAKRKIHEKGKLAFSIGQIIAIRTARVECTATLMGLVKKYRSSKKTINKICSGEIYKDYPGPLSSGVYTRTLSKGAP